MLRDESLLCLKGEEAGVLVGDVFEKSNLEDAAVVSAASAAASAEDPLEWRVVGWNAWRLSVSVWPGIFKEPGIKWAEEDIVDSVESELIEKFFLWSRNWFELAKTDIIRIDMKADF